VGLEMKLITIRRVIIWERWNKKKKKWEYNHYSPGWSDEKKPLPLSSDSEQKKWDQFSWWRYRGIGIRIFNGVEHIRSLQLAGTGAL